MGLSGGSKCIFISSKLTSKEFSCILEDRYNDNIHLKDSCTVRRPTVDIDANKVAFRYLNTAIGPAGTVFGIAKALSCLGIDVVLVGDPDNFQYDTKKATIADATTPVKTTAAMKTIRKRRAAIAIAMVVPITVSVWM